MPLDAERAHQHLAEFRLEPLFVEELGWDHFPSHLNVSVDGENYRLRGVAEKRGMAAFVVEADDGVPNYATRRKIERETAKSVHEHLIIYADGARTTQVWQWVRREPGRPTACRELNYQAGQPGEALIQRLDAITFTLDEEANISIVDVTRRARAAFDVERITRRFYDLFKAEHDAFLGFIRGLESQEDLEWYTSVMLNRLMFVYFIQKKGFLDDDRDYLRNRLASVQADAGRDQFHSFYRHFLLRLFHEGLGQRRRSSELDALLGRVPYLNGGLFDIHDLERVNSDIEISDDAFERLFDFFDAYQWHLDDRPLRADNEINPDVLGYIFEKYINQKQMGAYYTKEDITKYITHNSLIPRLFERLQDEATDFEFDSLARLLRADPDRYIHEPLRHGIDCELPDEVAAALDSFPRPKVWNDRASPDLGLPAETWREVADRRHAYKELQDRLSRGEVATVADLITLNLEVAQLALDLVQDCDSPALLGDIYRVLTSLTVLDPACGSGAFLFAALNVLQPLYDGVLQRMAGFLADNTADVHGPEFVALTQSVAHHPSPEFFVLKTIVVNNLYGVDIMEEAVEICKLRLFLRLVSKIGRYADLEPLPDIDFNIRCGNSVVGFARFDDIEAATRGETPTRLDFAGTLPNLRDAAAVADRAAAEFRIAQLSDVSDADRASLKARTEAALRVLRDALDLHLAQEYGLQDDGSVRQSWIRRVQPFHWATEFDSTMRDGGFDVVIGNPPYLERHRLAERYAPLDFETQDARDIYAWFIERSFRLRRDDGRLGFIVPVSIVSSASFTTLRHIVTRELPSAWFANFAHRPSQLFEGAGNRLTIILHSACRGELWSTRYHRWNGREGERENLFPLLRFRPVRSPSSTRVPKVGADAGFRVLTKLGEQGPLAGALVSTSAHPLYWVRVPGYFCQFFTKPPLARPVDGGPERVRGEVNTVHFANERFRRAAHAALNSTTYYFWHCAWTDGRHINPSDVKDFPLHLEAVPLAIVDLLVELSHDLDKAFAANTSLWRKSGLLIDSVDSAAAKNVLDDVDSALAKHYGFDSAELDFVIGYDLKYRLGDADG